MKIVKKTKRMKNFFRNDIWTLNMDELSKAKARIVKYSKVAMITIKTFSSQKIGYQAVALSFFSSLAAVPLVAIMFAVTDGIGLAEVMKDMIYKTFSSSQQTIDTLLGFSENVISQAQSSAMGLISSIFFGLTVIVLMLNIEKVFNNVWRVKERRKMVKRLSYVAIMILLSPFVVMLFFLGSIIYSHMLSSLGLDNESWGIIRTMASWALFGVLVTFVLTTMYKLIPNAEVSFGAAFRAAIPSALGFTIVQFFYLETQVLVTNFNTIYGAFAAVPLFMIWLNLGWFVILMGAELSYAFQHVDSYKIED